MAYTPENNPYIPGDPYSYDLKWVVDKIRGWKDPLDSAERAKASEEAAAASAQEAADSAQAAADSEAAAKNYSDHIADPVSGIVTDWLTDHITQPTTPAIDTSLSVAGAAADAKAAGVDGLLSRGVAITAALEGFDKLFNYDLVPVAYTLTQGECCWYDGSIRAFTATSVTNKIALTRGSIYQIKMRQVGTSGSPFITYDRNGNVSATRRAEATNTVTNFIVGSEYAREIQITTVNNETDAIFEVVNIRPKTNYNKKWAAVGDSLTEVNSTATYRYTDYISAANGLTVVNLGKGGTGFINPGNSTNFVTRMAQVPADSDIITIFGSFNDMAYMQQHTIPIGDPADSGTTSLCGYINAAFDALFTNIPLANLGVISPCPWVSISPVSGNTTFGAAYSAALKACCERRSVPFLDLYNCSGLRPWDPAFVAAAYSRDPLSGVHPDEVGQKIIATKINEFIKSLII